MNLQDLFTLTTLTAAVNKLPANPGKVGAMGIFAEKGIATTSVMIDEMEGRLVLVPDTSRNIDGQAMRGGKRTRRTFTTAHLPLTAQLLPADLQNMTAFGSETATDQQAKIINDKLTALKNSIEATREYHRIGALRGKILDADGTTVLYDLFKEFGVTKKSIDVAFTTASTDIRKACMEAKRFAEGKLGGVMVTGFRALCGKDYFDALTGHANVKKVFEGWQAAQDRLGGDVRSGFVFGGIEFMEYDVTVSGQKFIPDDVAQVFPIGAGAFAMYNAPANYNETVNTVGQAYYAKSEPRRFGKGWDIEVQANPLALCLYPEALVELKAV